MHSTKHLIFFLIGILQFIFSGIVLAADSPTLSGTSGSFTHGSKITLNGSGFGKKDPALPYFFDNFESGQNGQTIVGKKGHVGNPIWKEYETYGKPLYSNTDRYGKGSLSVHKVSDGNSFLNAGIDGLFSEEAYLSYVFKWKASGTNWQSAIYKLSRITPQGGLYSGAPSVYPQYQPANGWAYDSWYAEDNTREPNNSFPAPSQNKWHRAEIFMRLSSPAGTSNGALWTSYNNVLNIDLENVVTKTSTVSDKYLDSFILPFAIANNSAQTYTFWADDVYFDRTQARVEIGNNSNFSSCTSREIQIPTAWSADGSSISILFNQGSFSNSQIVYLFVIDSNGNVSNNGQGVAITIGDSTDSVPVPPVTVLPKILKITPQQ